MSKISIIVPVYRVEKYIKRCIDSILAQTFKDFELILVEDSSPDSCADICDEYATKDTRICVLHHNKNQGVSAARNTGIEWALNNSDSEWIAFIDSDDWVHPQYIQILYEAVQMYNADISACGCIKTNEERQFKEIRDKKISLVDVESYWVRYGKISTVVPWAKLYRKTCFLTERYPLGKIYEDAYTTHKVLFKQDTIAFVFEDLYIYYINPSSITQSCWNIKHLDSIDALYTQIEYFKNYGYKRAYKLSAEGYIRRLYEQRRQLRKRINEYPAQYKEIEKRLRVAIIKYGFACDFLPIIDRKKYSKILIRPLIKKKRYLVEIIEDFFRERRTTEKNESKK